MAPGKFLPLPAISCRPRAAIRAKGPSTHGFSHLARLLLRMSVKETVSAAIPPDIEVNGTITD
jgi:hypothetical protein